MSAAPIPSPALLEDADLALARAAMGRHTQSLLLLGADDADPAPVLAALQDKARKHGALVILINGAAADQLSQRTAQAIEQWLETAPEGDAVKIARRSLNGFMRAHGLTSKREIALQDTELGVADTGMLDHDLPELLATTAKAAKTQGQAVLIAIEQMDHMPLKTIGTVISALHKTSQGSLPMLLFGAGSKDLLPMPAIARSYAERMFKFHTIAPNQTEPTPDADQPTDPRATGLPVSTPARSARPDHPKP